MLKFNEQGQLVDDRGTPVEVGGKALTFRDFEGVLPQSEVNRVVQDRLARSKEAHDKQIDPDHSRLTRRKQVMAEEHYRKQTDINEEF